MSAQENMSVIRAWLDAHNRDDIDAELAFWDDQAELSVVPANQTLRGIDELKHAAQLAVASQGRKEITNLFASDDWACVEYTAHATLHGPMEVFTIQIPAGETQRTELKVCFLAHIKHGKIDRAREYWDRTAILQQLGIVPAAE